MFALLLHESMNPFYQNISSFPTAIFTVLLAVCTLYWICAMFGLVDIDALDLTSHDGGLGHAHHETIDPDVFAGLLLKLGLNGVPLTIIVSFISLFGWTISYFAVHFLFPLVPDGLLQYVAGIPILIGALFIAATITSVLIRPLRPLFKDATQDTLKLVLGQTAVVRTSHVDEKFGEANLADGGAGLILKVRAAEGQNFSKGDRVVLLEYFKESNTYRVVSEAEFSG